MLKPKLFLVAMSGVVVSSMFAQSASAAVIAYWRFEPGANFLADSSGNGNTLFSPSAPYAPTQDTAVANVDGGSGSALFASGDGQYLQTANKLDLTNVIGPSTPILRISYALRANTTGLGVILEHTKNYGSNDGAFLATVNSGSQGIGDVNWKVPSAYHLEKLPNNTNNTWDLYRIEFDNQATVAADAVKIWRNGTLLADSNVGGWHGLPGGQGFLNDYLYIGAREGTGYYFNGNIDELKIETVAVPEPGSFALLLVGMVGFARLRRRK